MDLKIPDGIIAPVCGRRRQVRVWESGVRTGGHPEWPRSEAGSIPTGDALQIRNPLYLTFVLTLSRRSETDRTPTQAHELEPGVEEIRLLMKEENLKVPLGRIHPTSIFGSWSYYIKL